jgi:hypothetical protein
MEKKSFKEANIEDIVKSLIELTNRMADHGVGSPVESRGQVFDSSCNK